ncbi:ATP-binding protein [Nocardia sp. KC 131]|uniref:HAMP domain-containing sensor histidine kinase n=1 Tax=Nocardia arseniciresistens TaxID=3392119 RepID=UPI00398E7C6F
MAGPSSVRARDLKTHDVLRYLYGGSLLFIGYFAEWRGDRISAVRAEGGMRVAQTVIARARLRNLEQWRVRWKVTAAVAVPLAAAMLLGSLRLTVFFNDYSNYTEAADRISDIPAITALESAASTVAGGQVYGMTTDQDLVELSTAITEATVRSGRKGIDATVNTSLREMIATSEVIRAGGKGGGGDPMKAVGLNDMVAREAVGTVDKLLTPIQISSVVTGKTQLFDLLLGKLEGFNWLMVAMSAIQDSSKVNDFNTIQGSFLTMTNTVERDFPAAKPELDRVVRPNNVLLKESIDEAIDTGKVNVADVRRLSLGTRDVYTKLASDTVDRIFADVDQVVDASRTAAIKASVVVLGTLIAASVFGLLVARSLLRPLRRLRAGAAALADRDLPDEVERISLGAQLEHIVVNPVPVHTGEEIGEIARTVDRLHVQALKLAAQQQQLRDQVNDMFETMARRNQTLVDRQLSMIDALEFEEKDPDRLDQLFRLDHLAARMRRNSANLLVLAGTKSRVDRSGPVEVRDILRAAGSEVEDYQRVKTGAAPDGWVTGTAATDLVHLIAELMENALRASPPESEVSFAYSRTSEGGLLIEVIDQGIGIVAGELDEINRRLATLATATLATTRQMGLFVVGRLAERHGITVRLRRTQDRALNPGITASLHIPAPLMAVPPPDQDTRASGQPVLQVHRDTLHPPRAPMPQSGNRAVQSKPMGPMPGSSRPSKPRAGAIGQQPLAPLPAAEPSAETPRPAPAITSYGLPKRVPGTNRRRGRKTGENRQGTATATLGPTAPVTAAKSTSAPTTPPSTATRPTPTTTATRPTPPDTAAHPTPPSTAAQSAQPPSTATQTPSGTTTPSTPPSTATPSTPPGTTTPSTPPSTATQTPSGTTTPSTPDTAAQSTPPGTGRQAPPGTAAQSVPTAAPSTTPNKPSPTRPAPNLAEMDTRRYRVAQTAKFFRATPTKPVSNADEPGPASPPSAPAVPPADRATTPISSALAEAADQAAAATATPTTRPAPAAGNAAPTTSPATKTAPSSAPSLPTNTTTTNRAAKTSTPMNAAPEQAAAPITSPAEPKASRNDQTSMSTASSPTTPDVDQPPTPSASQPANTGRTGDQAFPAPVNMNPPTPGTASAAAKPAAARRELATPIFAGMISAWLSDPETNQDQAPASWNSAADEGWSAAQRAADQPVTVRTRSGLPLREPGNQLVPGGAEPTSVAQEHDNDSRPDPASIRAGLNNYDRGVRDGRTTRSSKPFAAEDIR